MCAVWLVADRDHYSLLYACLCFFHFGFLLVLPLYVLSFVKQYVIFLFLVGWSVDLI